MTAYYNEIDPDAAAVLRQLIVDDVIACGDVDERSIRDVQPSDLAGYTQCHFFAGGGLWSVAARLARWPDDRALWTGSCPCQPFSQAGKGRGTDDPRHLWPDFHRLIDSCRPAVVMGEQVAGKAGRDWLHGVRADLAGSAYAGRAVDIPACSVDAPHERNRLYWIAVDDTDSPRQLQRQGHVADFRGWPLHSDAGRAVADDQSVGGGRDLAERRSERRAAVGRFDASSTLGNGNGNGKGLALRSLSADGRRTLRREGPTALTANNADRGQGSGALEHGHGTPARRDSGSVPGSQEESNRERREPRRIADRPRNANGRNGSWWADAEWIICHDGKARRTKSGLRLLVDGLPGRVGLWRVAGNAISPILAAEVIRAFLETEHLRLTEDIFG